MEILTFIETNRQALFTASMTVGTFVFTMKSFIVQTMKKEVYEKEKYRDYVTQIHKFKLTAKKNTENQLSIFAPLRNLSNALTACISMAFLNAALLISKADTACTTLGILIFLFNLMTWLALAFAVYSVTSNLQKMLDFSEWEHAKEERPDTSEEEKK